MSAALLLVGAFLVLVSVAAAAAAAEARWRGLIRRELAEEVSLAIISPSDREALASFGRFRKDWLGDVHERRTFRKLAGRLARAKARQRDCGLARQRLLQVEILTLRTRLRTARRRPGGRRGRDSVDVEGMTAPPPKL